MVHFHRERGGEEVISVFRKLFATRGGEEVKGVFHKFSVACKRLEFCKKFLKVA